MVQLGYSPDSYGVHSLRAGGATAAANAGVPDRVFKRHGQWKTDGAKEMATLKIRWRKDWEYQNNLGYKSILYV